MTQRRKWREIWRNSEICSKATKSWNKMFFTCSCYHLLRGQSYCCCNATEESILILWPQMAHDLTIRKFVVCQKTRLEQCSRAVKTHKKRCFVRLSSWMLTDNNPNHFSNHSPQMVTQFDVQSVRSSTALARKAARTDLCPFRAFETTAWRQSRPISTRTYTSITFDVLVN